MNNRTPFNPNALNFKDEYIRPGGECSNIMSMLRFKNHILIGGATGSGKSVLINAFIHALLLNFRAYEMELVLIDPKRVELVDYKYLPQTIAYATETNEIIEVLKYCIAVMEKRFTYMQEHHLKKFPSVDMYIIIDEYADLMTTAKEETKPLICRLAQLGRAAKIHLIVATQRTTRDIIDGQIKVNLDTRIALRVPTAQDSRNIIETSGAEDLPKYGYALMRDGADLYRFAFDPIPQEEINRLVEHWKAQTK